MSFHQVVEQPCQGKSIGNFEEQADTNDCNLHCSDNDWKLKKTDYSTQAQDR